MIMQSNMTMNAQVIKRKRWTLHGSISRNGHGKAIIGRYGGCFEEDIINLCVIERIISRGLDAHAKLKEQCTVP